MQKVKFIWETLGKFCKIYKVILMEFWSGLTCFNVLIKFSAVCLNALYYMASNILDIFWRNY